MIRFAAVFAVLALAGCATPPARTAAQTQQMADASQVYQRLQVADVQQQMMYYNNMLTYGNAAVSCGLRTPQWYTLLQGIYAQQYALELKRIPLNADQQAQVLAYASVHVQNPSPPPYICGRLQQDSTLAAFDQAVAVRAFEVASAK